MKIDDIKTIGVIGAGNMGHQIVTLCAIHGYKGICTDSDEATLKKAEAFVDRYLPGRVEKERLTAAQAEQARKNLTFTSSLKESSLQILTESRLPTQSLLPTALPLSVPASRMRLPGPKKLLMSTSSTLPWS